ncbi:P-type conjugative transfer protein TrbG [Phenylobacterium sp.]|uniref:P-type conjugative transfer protein TrbG n=1 Tax=Phenylobacterium sp. TaxID=1871053 RepID=UPI0027321DE0|nr:P-type conjugative transfer protein TrbG [Phenylobacterium sp.]MDP1598523.1 P-type conjugative transfer protein TrbG [Phenylobacterium sp.]MDP3592690.1 P-type conjugative transfer protein TrbG [Phenylobacterium sp.]
MSRLLAVSLAIGLCVTAPASSQTRAQAPASASAPGPAPPAAGAPLRAAPKPVTIAAPAAPKPRPSGRRGPGAIQALDTIDRANAQARDWPSPGSYVNSAIYYDYEPGRIYTIQTSPRFLTTIALRPGERLISKAAGDTVRWVLGETQAGAGAGEQVIIFVKPIRPDLRTNIVLTTDQRTYLLDAVSSASPTFTSVLSWNYPQEQALAAAAQRAAHLAAEAKPAGGEVLLDHLDFNYRIDLIRGRSPRWLPLRAFDDGAKTFIAFPPDLATSEAPPLFLVGAEGQAELVNYRLQGGHYVVDRLIERAELRLGEKRQTIVRITRTRARS